MAKLPVLMYHHISLTQSEGLTISSKKLEEQFKYLAEKGYKTHYFKDLADIKKFASKKNIIITFDDGYVSQKEIAIPLLKKYNLKATFFIPLNYLGKTDIWNTDSIDIMTVEQLQSIDSSIVELGYHSFFHKKYHELSTEEIQQDTDLCFKIVSEKTLPFTAALAYPYGKYPRDISGKKSFISLLQKNGFTYGLRIGNRLNTFPFRNPFEIQRIDVKGEYSLKKFAQKVKFGKIF